MKNVVILILAAAALLLSGCESAAESKSANCSNSQEPPPTPLYRPAPKPKPTPRLAPGTRLLPGVPLSMWRQQQDQLFPRRELLQAVFGYADDDQRTALIDYRDLVDNCGAQKRIGTAFLALRANPYLNWSEFKLTDREADALRTTRRAVDAKDPYAIPIIGINSVSQHQFLDQVMRLTVGLEASKDLLPWTPRERAYIESLQDQIAALERKLPTN